MLGLIVLFLVRYLPRFGPARRPPTQATITTHQNRLSRAEWLARAEESDRVGLYREAVQARYRATVAGLIDDEELPDSPGATPTELRGSFRADPARTDPFASSTAAFSDVWYGGDDADRNDSEQLDLWDHQVLNKGS
jgi:hypothetical protein